MEIGEYIKQLRSEKNMTTAELAYQAGISRPYLTQIEKGSKGLPSEKILRKIANALDIPLHILISLRDKHQLSDNYIEEVMDYESIYRKLEETKELLQQTMSKEPNLSKKHSYLKNIRKIEEVEKLLEEVRNKLNQLTATKHPPKYPPKVDNIISDLFEIGEQGQDFVKRQINLYKDMFMEKR